VQVEWTVAARPPAVTVLYDHDCGFCRWSVGRLLAWDRAGGLRPLAIQSAEGQLLLADLTPEQRLATAHAVDAAGRRTSGGDALAAVAAVLPGGAPLAALGRRAPALARAGYRAVAGRRTLWGKLVSDAAKARADERIAQRSASST
jgi:predicted DCC family thiol-disulfide oxidoreductase YuxK